MLTGSVEGLVRLELQVRKALQVLEVQDQKVVLVCLDHPAFRVCMEIKELEACLVRIVQQIFV